MKPNFGKICSDLISGLEKRKKEIISRRFGFDQKERETLESIGKSFGITRERVRQIEESALKEIEPKLKKYQSVYLAFLDYFKKAGGLKKEEILLADLGGEKWQNEVYFLLDIKGQFVRLGEDKDFYSAWATDQELLKKARETVFSLIKKLDQAGKPFSFKEISALFKSNPAFLNSSLEISKQILKNEEDLYGLKKWPEFFPKGVKDKAYLLFKKLQKPLHFSEVAKLIGGKIETVHNELIKDPRFVLVGRGTYALAEWGYYPGEVKEVILKILKEEGPLTKEEILERVKKQRIVKPQTVFLNLSNRNYFERDEEGKYRPKVREI